MCLPIGLTLCSAGPGRGRELLSPPKQTMQVMSHLNDFSELCVAASHTSLSNINTAIKMYTKPLTISPLEMVGLLPQTDSFLSFLNQNMHM